MFSLKHNSVRTLCVLLLAVLVAGLVGGLCAEVAEAADAGDKKITAWEGALDIITNSLKGPVAQGLSIIMIIVGVGVLMFGGNLQGWGRWVAFAIIAIGTLAAAPNLVDKIFSLAK